MEKTNNQASVGAKQLALMVSAAHLLTTVAKAAGYVPDTSSKTKDRPEYEAGDLLTPKQAGEFLDLSPRTLANWRTIGCGPNYTKFGRVRYQFSDVQTFISERHLSSTSQQAKRTTKIGGM